MTLTQINKAGLDEIALDHVFTIGASGSSAYTFQGEGLNGTVNNPTLYLTRGKTYRFENGSGGHPIRIQSTSGASGTAYNTGVTNNAGSGTVIVEVQHDAPDVLYYQCTSHAAMNGILYITGALADGGVTTAKLADDAVTLAKMANDSVSASQIINNAVTVNALAADAVTTPKIGDQQVTLAKLPHGTSSNDGKFLRANNGADPTFETVNTDLVSDTSPQLGGNLDANSKAILLGDSTGTLDSTSEDVNRLCVGAGRDFQIVHNGNHTYLNQVGTGDLYIRSVSNNNDIIVQSSAGGDVKLRTNAGEDAVIATRNADVALYYDNVKKSETRSNGLGIEGDATFQTGSRHKFIGGSSSNLELGTYSSSNSSRDVHMSIDSAGNVGIARTSPDARLHIDTNHYVVTNSGISTTGIHLDGNFGNAGEYGGGISFGCGGDGSAAIAARQATSSQHVVGLSFFTHDSSTSSANAVEKVRIHDGGTTSFTAGVCLGNNLTLSTANTLDDYEEGTWTPTGSGFTVSTVYSARYTRIGRIVHVSGYVQAAAGSGTSSSVLVTNLPFNTKGSSSYSYGSGRVGGGNSGSNIVFQTQSGSNQVKIYINDGAINEGMISGQHIIFSIVYEIN